MWAALQLASALKSGECTAADVVGNLLDRLDRLTPLIGAVAATDPERSIAEAVAADQRLRAGEGRILEGVPFTVKDWIDAEGWPISGAESGDPGDRERRPAVDAPAVARVRAAGGVLLAVTRVLAIALPTVRRGIPMIGPARRADHHRAGPHWWLRARHPWPWAATLEAASDFLPPGVE